MEIFDNYIIVDEKTINDINLTGNSKIRDLTTFASLEFDTCPSSQFLIRDISGVSQASEPLAQIVLWEWSQGTQFVLKKIILNCGGTTEMIQCPTSIVIRILKKRESIENPCPPLSSPDDDLTVHIGDRHVTVSAHWLMFVSQMVRGMLSADMKEKQQRTISLDSLGINMEQFMDFLEAISIASFKHPFFPNRNFLINYIRAHRKLPKIQRKMCSTFSSWPTTFRWTGLMERCGVHLMNCVEIPLFERILLVERFRLANVKQCFSRMLVRLTDGK